MVVVGLLFWAFCLFDIIVLPILLNNWLNKGKVDTELARKDQHWNKGRPEDISGNKNTSEPNSLDELVGFISVVMGLVMIVYVVWFFSTGQWVPCIGFGQEPC